MSRRKKLTYEEAYRELENILQQLQEGEISMEKLPELVQRAGELVNYCREKLRSIEKEVEKNMGTAEDD